MTGKGKAVRSVGSNEEQRQRGAVHSKDRQRQRKARTGNGGGKEPKRLGVEIKARAVVSIVRKATERHSVAVQRQSGEATC